MKKWSFRKKLTVSVLFLVGLPILSFGGFLGYNYFSGNVHTLIPGQVYRSGQMDGAALAHYTKKFDLKTIINLRGVWPNDQWYQVESQFAKNHHLNYFAYHFRAQYLPTKKMLRELVHTLQTAPKPLIFHCEGGADRTGMAAAISVILFDKHPTISQIKDQASWRYNAISSKTVGYQVLMNYFSWLKKHGLKPSKANFLSWLKLDKKMVPYEGHFF